MTLAGMTDEQLKVEYMDLLEQLDRATRQHRVLAERLYKLQGEWMRRALARNTIPPGLEHRVARLEMQAQQATFRPEWPHVDVDKTPGGAL